MRFFATTCGIETLQGCRYSLPDAHFPIFNSVWDTQLPIPAVQDTIVKIQKIYHAKKQFCWWITDLVEPQNLADALLTAGFKAVSAFKGMFMI